MTENAPHPVGGDSGGRWFARVQYLLPHHLISRITWLATRSSAPWFKNALIRGFLALFKVDMSEAVQVDPFKYRTFNEFFTRPLAPGVRPLEGNADSLACPVDGTVSECGSIERNRLLQAKGRDYTLGDLLAGEPWANRFEGGDFVTLYLAPFNYHRIHMPLRGRLLETVYVPGRLFSVNAATARHVPRLFARNERVVTLFETSAGRMAVVLVGALNVGSMDTVWAGNISPRRRRVITRLDSQSVTLQRGEELGRFNMGSTVILLFEAGRMAFEESLQPGLDVKVGQRLGIGL